MKETVIRLPAPIGRPLHIAQVSDLHDHSPAAVLAALAATPPDLIAVTGDLFNHLKDARHALPFLQQAAGIAPVYYSLGNHERLEDGDEQRIVATGAVLLDNTAVRHGEIWVGGLTSGFGNARQGNLAATPAPDMAFLDAFAAKDGYKLLLCHHPEYYPRYVRDRAIDLTLAGHAHGGQWRLFGRGVFAPGQGMFPTYTGGVYEGRLVVSRGLANTAPVPRFGNPTELVRIYLTPKEAEYE